MEESQQVSDTLLSLLSDDNFESTSSRLELEEECAADDDTSFVIQVQVESIDDDDIEDDDHPSRFVFTK